MSNTKITSATDSLAYDEFDLMDALESAAEFLEKENWDGATQQLLSANKEASKRIMRMVNRLQKRR